MASWFDRGDIVAYELLPTPHEIARLPHERTTRSGVQTPAIALSPDGARLAMYRKDDGVFYVINVVDGAAREVRIGESIKTPLNNLFWIDATTLTFSAASYGIGRATLDAAGSLAITKTIDMFGASALSPSGGQLVAFDFAQPTQLWFIELPR